MPLKENQVSYFAYGSNLCSARLQQRVPSANFICPGKLGGYRLRFNKIGLDGSGKGNIQQTECVEDVVWGGVFEIDRSEMASLDSAESLGVGYHHQHLNVLTPQGQITALTYIAMLKDDHLRPFHWYKAYIVQGALACGLPEAYIQQLKGVISIADLDVERCQQHTASFGLAQFYRESGVDNMRRIIVSDPSH